MYILFTNNCGTKRVVHIPEGISWRFEHQMFEDEKNGYFTLHLIIGKDDYLIGQAFDWISGRKLTDVDVYNHYDRFIETVYEKLKVGNQALNLDAIEQELVDGYDDDKWK